MFLELTALYFHSEAHQWKDLSILVPQHSSSNISKQCGVPRWKSKKLAVTQLQTLHLPQGQLSPSQSLNNLSFSSTLLVPDNNILQDKIMFWLWEDSSLVHRFLMFCAVEWQGQMTFSLRMFIQCCSQPVGNRFLEWRWHTGVKPRFAQFP